MGPNIQLLAQCYYSAPEGGRVEDSTPNFFYLVAFNMQALIACVLDLVGITLSLSSLCSLAKATFSITTKAIVNELSVEEMLIYCFI